MAEMTDRAGTLERLAEELGQALAALEALLAPESAALLFAELGLENPPGLPGDGGFGQKLASAAALAAALSSTLEELAGAKGDSLAEARAVAELLDGIRRFLAALREVAAGMPQTAEVADLAATFVERLLDVAVVSHLEAAHPFLRRVLSLLTIVEIAAVGTPGAQTDPDTVPLLRRRLHPERIRQLIGDPLAVLREVYGWGSGGFDGKLLFANARDVFDALIPVAAARDEDEDGPADLDLFGLLVRATKDVSPPGLDGSLFVDLPGQLDLTLGQLTDEVRCALQLEGAFPSGLSLRLIPPATLEIPDVEGVAGTVALAVLGESQDPASPFIILGEAGGSRLQAARASAAVTAELTWDAGGGKARADVGFEVQFVDGKLVVDSSSADGFLRGILPSDGLQASFDFGLAWSHERGFTFRGAAGLDATLPVGISIGGVLKVPTIHLGLLAGDAGLQAEVSAGVGLSIGPVQALIDRVGMAAAVTFPASGGNLGIADVALGFKPPSGVGLAIDSAGVSGGGFLSFDPAKHEYAGVLQLEFNQLALQAFGLITTQVAGGAGYSLLALIDADFPPVQLGWGFTLNGVGGLMAIHRSASVDALRAGLKGGKLSTVLFPRNAITNAPQILAALDSYFPTAPGRFLFGPMALIGWGTPTLITAAVAVIVELPEPIRILLLARIEARLPSPSSPLVRINMDALGVLDLSQGTLSLDATLFDSKLLDFTLSGDMALRAAWSGQREFLLAVGGFHPRFTPPAGFPALQRITIDMPSGIVSKLRLAAYLAITSNTVQFGADLDVFIGVSGFGLSGHLGFDALLQLEPFHFDADISGSVALTAGGDDLMSVGLDATISGPAPWNIAGKFKIHLLFFTVHKSFSHSWGEDAPALPPVTVDVGQSLKTALADPRSWSAQLPDGAPALVAVRKIEDPNTVLAHPLARPEVHERIVPLGLDITRFGEAVPSGGSRFTLADLRIGRAVPGEPVRDDFAPAQFFELSDEEKLARPSFERHDAGMRLGAVPAASGAAVPKDIAYETFYIDEPGGAPRTDPVAPALPLFLVAAVLAIGSAGRAAGRRYQAPGDPVRVQEPAFVVVDADTLAPAGDGPSNGVTYSEAQALLRSSNRRGSLRIVSLHEAAVA